MRCGVFRLLQPPRPSCPADPLPTDRTCVAHREAASQPLPLLARFAAVPLGFFDVGGSNAQRSNVCEAPAAACNTSTPPPGAAALDLPTLAPALVLAAAKRTGCISA